MCQLTLIKSNKDISVKLLLPILYTNSLSNVDGTGIYSYDTKKIIKSKYSASLIINELYDFLNENRSRLYLAHVRLASTNKKNITDELAHPYITDNYIVFHNGTFEGVVCGENSTDTLEFAKKLSENYDKDIIKAFNKTYLGGKFALFIVDKNTGKIYILRGKTATLNYFKLEINEEIVELINTEDHSIHRTIDLINITKSLFYNDTPIKIIEESSLEENTAYEYTNNGLVKLGEVKEYKKPVVTSESHGYGAYRYNDNFSTYTTNTWVKDYSYVHNIKNSWGISLFELDFLVKRYFDKCIYSIYQNDVFKDLYNLLHKYYSKDKKKLWNKILNKEEEFVLDIYRKYNLKVPYFVNTVEELKQCLINT